MSEEKFVVKQYSSDSRPTIKGNGFDGLEVGETREEAEEFALWINHRLAERDAALERCTEEISALTHSGRQGELEKANVGLAGENERLRELLRQVSALMHKWDGGMDEMDGPEYFEAVEEWEKLMPVIDADLARTDSPEAIREEQEGK